jgi:hypothetical protein
MMEKYAKYVIRLDESGNVTNHYRNKARHRLVDCVVVLAPATFYGEYVEQAVALEIGLSRFVPYRAAEFKEREQTHFLPERTKIGTLPWSTVRRMLPTLYHAIQTCVDKRMETWTRAKLVQENIGKRGMTVYESWLTIRIPKDQPLLYALLRLKDEADRKHVGRNYAFVAEKIVEEIACFQRLQASHRGRYPDETIKKSARLAVVTSWMKKNITYRGYTKRSLEIVRALIAEQDIESLHIFDRACKIFKLPSPRVDTFLDQSEKSLGKEKEKLLGDCTLHPCHVVKREKKRTQHAKNCFTISIFGSKEHMIRIDRRNVANRLSGSQAKSSKDLPSDDDIPWDNFSYQGVQSDNTCPF